MDVKFIANKIDIMNIILDISNKLIMALAPHASLYGVNLTKYK